MVVLGWTSNRLARPMTFKNSFFALIFFLTLTVGCEAINEPAPPHGRDSLTPPTKTQTGWLDLSQAESFTVTAYFSPYAHGPTQTFYNFFEEGVIVRLKANNDEVNTPIEGMLFIFRKSVSRKAMKKWLNNQYSDGLYADAPRPRHSLDITSQLTITGREQGKAYVARDKVTYLPVTIHYSLAPIEFKGKNIATFNDGLVVYIPLDRPDREMVPEK